MDKKAIIGIVVIGGGLLWYMSSKTETPATLPATTTTSTTTPATTTDDDGDDSSGNGDGTTEDDEETTETTEGSDAASTVDPTDCSKYRSAQHEAGKVWMSSTQSDSFNDGAYRPSGIKMDDFETDKEQYFVNDVVNWELDLSVKNTSKARCGEKKYSGIDKKCWLAPSSGGSAAGNNCCLKWTVTWTDPQGQTYTDDSGVITRPSKPDPWSNLNGSFRIPNQTSSIGVWEVALRYWWKGNGTESKPRGEVTWDNEVFRVVPETCASESSSAENFASDFTRSIYAPAMSHQSFMQF